MTSRRSFLRILAGGLAAAASTRAAFAALAGKAPLGLQLWSVRRQLAKDLPGTLKQIKAWGFDEVETFGPYGAEIKTALADAGLKVRAMHVGWEKLEKDMASVLRDTEAVGAATVINPYMPHKSPSASRDEILAAARSFAKWSGECRKAGRRFAYHLHGQEFGSAPEGTLFDVLAKESGPDVGFEADVYWMYAGGVDPVALMKKYPGRFWHTHLKDMTSGVDRASDAVRGEGANAVLGTGQIDVRAIVAASPTAGVEMHFIEDESADPMGRIPQSVAYFSAL